ncbi:MAG: hypothetical protein ABIZ05_13815 [Pseudonocardiaceae bacterium]
MTADDAPPAGHPGHATHDGCSDALLVTGGAPARPGEIESLERFIQLCLDKLDRKPYLHPGNARELLEEIADRWRDVTPGTGTMVEFVAVSGRLDWPPELSDARRREIITQLLDNSGIIVAANGDCRFACQTAQEYQEYLAAYRIFRHHPRGPRWWQPRWKYRALRTTWIWPDGGVMLFLAALWWRVAKPAVDRRLRRLLLRDPDRDPNIRFVIELSRRNLMPGNDIPNHIAKLLRRRLADDRQYESRWVDAFRLLYRLKPMMAIVELEKVIQNPGPTITSRRRLAVVDEITKHDTALGAKNLQNLANNLTGTPQDRLSTTVQIDHRNPELGTRTMLRLVETPDMGELRADAAIYTRLPAPMCKLIGDDTLSDDKRLELSTELFKQDKAMAVALMERFAQTAHKDDTPLKIADMIRDYDQHVALRIATDVAWPVKQKIYSSVRRDAVILIGEIDPTQAIRQLDRLSKDPLVLGKVQVEAATLIVTKHHGSIDSLVDRVHDPKLDHINKAKAAKSIGEYNRATGAESYIYLAKNCALKDKSRLAHLRAAYKLDSGPAAAALAEVALNQRIPGPIRSDAVEIAEQTLGKARTIELYTTIATTTGNDTALAVAEKVMAMNPDAGQRLMGKLADRSNPDDKFLLTAARKAGVHGTPALMDLAYKARLDTVRLGAAQALLTQALSPSDRRKAELALQQLVKKHGAGKVRIDAALSLPEPSVVDWLITITQDRREQKTICFDALVKAEEKAGEKDEEKFRQALREFVVARGISKASLEKLRRRPKK